MEIPVTSSDLVSVIVPFLNGSQWLTEALDSVRNQTYPNWELIVIDDGSSAEHSAVARKYCCQYPGNIIYTEHPGHTNKGVSVSRNEAVRLARGKYLAFLDADDVWMPEKLTNQLAIFEKYPSVKAIFNAFIAWSSWQDKNAEDYLQPIGAPANKVYAPGTLNKLLYPFYDAASPAPSGIILTTEAFYKIGGFESAFSGIYELYEDQAFLSKLYLNETTFISQTADVLYRKRAGSMSSAANNAERYHIVRAFYFDWFENYLHSHRFYDAEFNSLIGKARQETVS